MTQLSLELDEELTNALRRPDKRLDERARDMIVLGLHHEELTASDQTASTRGLDSLQTTTDLRSPKWIARILGSSCLIVLSIIGISLHRYHDYVWEFLVLSGLIGGLLGWIVAVLASPTAKERQDFSTYGRLLSTFVSAYLLAKLSPLLDKLGSLDTFVKDRTFEELATRAAFALAAFLIALMWTFLLRRYSKAFDTQEPQ